MRRVIIVCNDSDYFLRHRLPIALALSNAGHEVLVMTGGRPLERRQIESFEYKHVTIDRFNFSLWNDLRFFFASMFAILRFKPHSILLITLKPAIYSGIAAILTRLILSAPKKVTILIPGLGRLMSPNVDDANKKMSLSRRITSAAMRFLSKREQVVFLFETQHDRRYLAGLGLVDDTKSFVVRGAGVDPSLYFPSQGAKSPGKIRILFASRLLASKGLLTFIGVAKRLYAEGKAEFVVAGMVEDNDPDRVEPAKLAVTAEISFLGEVGTMGDLIRSCDVVCLPTGYGEGIPRILIEAAACGLPSIASDIPGCREIIVDGETGMIIDGQTPADMEEALCNAVNYYVAHPDMMRQHGIAAYKRFVQDGFREQDVVGRFVDLLS